MAIGCLKTNHQDTKLRLSQIKLAGFKSFVDPTHVPVPGKRVCIVGPNGCGKSNIIDAVRWVLGESSARQLRGESMQDVIFNGSGDRKAANRASVELVFDNSLKQAAGPWAEYAEIAVKRVLQRDGESTYYINNMHVRRRDITDIFLGTGLGPRAYAIIEQGMISRIIEARPEELRIYLEEAAGVSKYKERRRETELRLRDTRQNLSRVNDIRQEIEKQLQRLEAQAEVAKQYQDVRAQITTSQNLLWFLKKRDAAAQWEKEQREVARLTNEVEAATAKLRELESELETTRTSHFAATDKLQEQQGELYSANAEVARLEQQIAYQRENVQRLAQQIKVLQTQRDSLSDQQRQSIDESARVESELTAILQRIADANAEFESENQKLPLVEARFKEVRQQHSEQMHELNHIQQALQIEEAHRSHAQKILQQLQDREARLREDLRLLRPTEAQALEQHRSSTTQMGQRLEEIRTRLAQTETNLIELENERREKDRLMQQAAQQVALLEAQINALQQLQDRLNKDEQSLEWLNAHHIDSAARLWHKLRIQPGWEDAFESILGRRLEAVSVDEFEKVVSLEPPSVSLTLYRPNTGNVASSDALKGFKPLSDYVSWKKTEEHGEDNLALLKDWLHQVYALETFEQGLSLQQQLPPGAMLVSKQGHIFNRDSVTYYAPQSEFHGALARQREIEELRELLQHRQTDAEQTQRDAAQAHERYTASQAQANALRAQEQELQSQFHDLQLEVQRIEQQRQHEVQRLEQVEHALAEIAAHTETEKNQLGASETTMEQLTRQRQSIQDRLEQSKLELDQAETDLEQQRQTISAGERRLQEAKFEERHRLNKLDDLKNLIAGIAEQLIQLETRHSELLNEQTQLSQTQLDDILQQALSVRQEKEKMLSLMRDQLAGVTGTLHELEQGRLQTEQLLHPLRNKVEEAKLRAQEARLKDEYCSQQLEEGGVDQTELAALAEKKLRPGALQQEIENLNRQLEDLGPVNLAALDELKSEQERKQYLDAQSEDLTNASETLEQAIKRMDKETRGRLEETFNEVNRHFSELFPSIFGGGKAQLILTGEEILDAGLTLVAQPPGKKNSSIHLLSGGEKALTALALIFSLFRLNPAPFCVLDEVDAPLDDTNTERFCDLLKKMSQHTQFLFITHNKITMEIAEQLIGVTMHESGVSRIVAVDVEQAVRLATEAAA